MRLKNAYIIKAESVEKDDNGVVQVVHCTYDTKSLSGSGTEASLRKIKGTLKDNQMIFQRTLQEIKGTCKVIYWKIRGTLQET